MIVPTAPAKSSNFTLSYKGKSHKFGFPLVIRPSFYPWWNRCCICSPRGTSGNFFITGLEALAIRLIDKALIGWKRLVELLRDKMIL
jgi:carbamoyl-phosphate synthase large subunit